MLDRTIDLGCAKRCSVCAQVFKDWQDHRYKFGDKVARLSTRAFLSPLKEDEEITASMAPGRDVTIKYKAKGELQVPLSTHFKLRAFTLA